MVATFTFDVVKNIVEEILDKIDEAEESINVGILLTLFPFEESEDGCLYIGCVK